MNKIKGDRYEIQIRDFIINVLGTPAYLWNHCPESILKQFGIIGSHNENRLRRKENKENPLPDTGIDIIQVENNNTCSLVQCKNGYKKGLTIGDLAGFMFWIATLDKLKGYVYYTDNLSLNVRSMPKNDRIIFVKHAYIENTITENVNNTCFTIDNDKLEYQNKAKDLAIAHYKNNNRGILAMPCGTGKTYTSYLISQNYNQIIIISPLKQFAKQNLDRYIEYGYQHKYLLVDSDGERNLDEIKKFIESNESFLISATYDSVDVIYDSIKHMKEPFFIIDEFHNLSKNNVTNEDDKLNKLLNSNHKILFMSATPRVYEMEDDDDFNENLFGKTIYKMSFNEAISNGYITDYKIWLPSIHEDNSKLNNELSIYEIDSTIKSKCIFLLSCLLNNGSRKCIVYCVDTVELNDMKEAIKKLDEYYCMDYNISQITSNDNLKTRTEILDTFAKSTKIELLFSIRILDECIDIPSCDSIFITYPSQSKIRTIQRLSRCIRVDKKNKFKIGNVYIWCNEYGNILETLSGIKEYDESFAEKIKINHTNQYNESDVKIYKNDVELVKKYVVEVKEYQQITWDDKLAKVKEYININLKRPSKTDNSNSTKALASWINRQTVNYNKKTEGMSNNEIYNKWTNFIGSEEYKKYFTSNKDQWKDKLRSVKKYIDINLKRPTRTDKNCYIKILGSWIRTQIDNYQKKAYIMSDNEIYNMWTQFINDERYKKFLASDKDLWEEKLIEVKKYIDINKKRPSQIDENSDIRILGTWVSNQIVNYNKKTKIMSDNEIYNKWTQFICDNRYVNFFTKITVNSNLYIIKMMGEYNDKLNIEDDIDQKLIKYDIIAKRIKKTEKKYQIIKLLMTTNENIRI